MSRWLVGLAAMVLAGSLCVSCAKREEAEKKPAAEGVKPVPESAPPAETTEPAKAEPTAGEVTEPAPAPVGDIRPAIAASIEKAVAFLAKAQHADGGWLGQDPKAKESDVGVTGLVLEALAKVPAGVRAKNQDVIEKGVKYLLANQRPDGSINNKDGMLANYRTSIAARALIALDREKYKTAIEGAVKYTKGIQGKDPKDASRFGSMGYGSDPNRGDIINTSEAIEMLRQAGVPEDDPAFKDAMVFLGRVQNLDEYAEQGVKTQNDGGAIYLTDRSDKGASKAGTIKLPDGTEVPRSYGGATYNLLKDYLFMGLKKDNPRVLGAYDWIRKHYTVKEDPEMGQQGLYYSCYTLARTLQLWGTPMITDGAGVEHNWAKELAERIVSLQGKDGSWVNAEDRWWESDPSLVTAYTISALNICDEMLGK